MSTKIKTIAMYLPQFHKIRENDEWWGEGFTEWTSVKAAKKLIEGHQQPKEPLDDYYYNLLDKSTMKWQADLANKYGVYGFSFYHYWFKDGRRILEAPAENLLKWKDININFCFTWANETWARSWSNISYKNSWSEEYERNNEDSLEPNGILLEQKYQGEDQWKEHFRYLLPFFQDERYIKKDGCPVFIIFRPEIIPCLKDMIECWNEMASLNGFEKLFIMGATDMEDRDYDYLDGMMIREPNTSMIALNRNKEGITYKSGISVYDNASLVKCNISRALTNRQYNSVYVNYDDTPRRGIKGKIIERVTPNKFYQCLKENIVTCLLEKKDFIFINAWNEWGEGMYLEPDKINGYKFLEVHKKAINESIKPFYKLKLIYNKLKRRMRKKQDIEEKVNENLELIKYRNYFHVLNQWMLLKEDNKAISTFLLENGYQRIAIYGMGFMGKHLCEELKDSEITIEYAIDIKARIMNYDFPIVEPDDDLKPVDVIIVTVTFDYENISSLLKEKTSYSIISLEKIIAEM